MEHPLLGGLTKSFPVKENPERPDHKYTVMKYGDLGIVFYTEENIDKIDLRGFSLSAVGVEVLSLTRMEICHIYINEIARVMKGKNFRQCKIGSWAPEADGLNTGIIRDLQNLAGFEAL